MQQSATLTQNGDDIPRETLSFYQNVIATLNRASLPYLIGGAYALNHYTGISRKTEDFDIFIARADYERISKALAAVGYETELTYPHWLGKVRCNKDVIDLVFSSGNGVAEVDQDWFDYADSAELFGIPVKMCPPEETLWSKAFIMERERFDGADVAHLILTRAQQLDWTRLLQRFDPHWRLLLSHLILFGFIYPAQRNIIPSWVMETLLSRLRDELDTPAKDSTICGGTLLSREQYLSDIQQRGYQDARIAPYGNMAEDDTVLWTKAIKNKFD